MNNMKKPQASSERVSKSVARALDSGRAVRLPTIYLRDPEAIATLPGVKKHYGSVTAAVTTGLKLAHKLTQINND